MGARLKPRRPSSRRNSGELEEEDLERSGVPLSLADPQVASIAITNELVLVTGNVDHFSRIPGLPAENWM